MAVTRLGKGAGNRATGTSATLGTSWASFSITTSDANTVAVVAVNCSISTNATTTISATYGGVAMTQYSLVNTGTTSTTRGAAALFYLFNPGTGSKTVAITTSGATKTQVAGIDVSFSGVDTTIGSAQAATATTHSVTSTSNGYSLRVLSNGNALTSPNQTSEYLSGASVTGQGDYISVQSAVGTGSSISFTCSGTALTPNSIGIALAEYVPPVPISTLTDDFNTGSTPDAAKWNIGTFANLASLTSGQLNCDSSSFTTGVRSINQYSLIGSAMYVQLFTNTSTTTQILANTASYVFGWFLNGTAATPYIDGAGAGTPRTHTSGDMYQVRESGGTLYVEYSTDGGGSWNVQQSSAVGSPALAELTQMRPSLNGFGTGTTTRFDNFNVAPPNTGTIASALQKATASLTGTSVDPSADGTISAALQKATAALTGTQSQSGTMGATAAKATAALTAAQAQTGTITAASPAATAALTGTQAQTGTVAAALQKAAAALTAVMQPSGTITATGPKATAAFTGTHEQTGSITATLQRALAAAAGFMQPDGAITAGLPKATAAATATQSQDGTIAAAARSATAAANGNTGFTPDGIITAATLNATTALTGLMEPSGTVAVTAARTTANLAGTQAQSGSASATLKPTAAALTAAQAQSGTIAATEKVAVAALAASQAQTASIAATTKATATALTAAHLITGTIAAAVQQATADLTGAQAQTGSISASLQKAVFNAAASAFNDGTLGGTLAQTAAAFTGAQVISGLVTAALKPATFSATDVPQGIHAALRQALFNAIGHLQEPTPPWRTATVGPYPRTAAVLEDVRAAVVALAQRSATAQADDRHAEVPPSPRLITT